VPRNQLAEAGITAIEDFVRIESAIRKLAVSQESGDADL
jgi:hypothetical protein